jgi:hypothetical protein
MEDALDAPEISIVAIPPRKLRLNRRPDRARSVTATASRSPNDRLVANRQPARLRKRLIYTAQLIHAMGSRKRIMDWFFNQSWAIPVWIILGALVAPFACVVGLVMLLKLLGVLA